MFGIGDIARAFSQGIGGLGKKIKKLGESDGPPGIAPGSYSKPTSLAESSSAQNPAATVRQGFRGIEDAVADAERNARDDIDLERRNLPISRRDLPIPGPTPAPSLHNLRTALPSLSSRPSPPLAAPPAPPGAVPDLILEMDLDRHNLPIPRLPGHPGGPTRYSPVDAAEYDYVMKGARRDAEGRLLGKEEGGGFDRDWKQTALSTLAGAARGYATTGDIGGAIGGAAAGGAGSLISPQAGREFNFDTLYRPKLEAEQARERAEKDRVVAEIFNQAKLDDLRATTEERQSQAQKNRLPAREPRPAPAWRQVVGPDGQPILVDMNAPENRGKTFTPYVKPAEPKQPRQPTAAELAVDPESGMSVEEMADASYNTRGGDQYVFDRLPARTRQIIRTGNVMVNGEERRATQGEIDAATREWERAIERQKKTDRDYTAGVIRRKRVGATKGGRGAAQPSAYKRNVNELPPLR